MTKKEAEELYLMYDLEPWYQANLERELGAPLPINLPKELQKKCFLLFYDEVKNVSKRAWEEELERGGAV